MRFIHYIFPKNSLFEGVTIDEILNDVVLLSYWDSDVVYMGAQCPMGENVNIEYCELNNIPIMRGSFSGRAFLYEVGKHLTLRIYKIGVKEVDVQTIISRVLSNLGINTTIINNDICLGNGRISMSAPQNKFLKNAVAADLILDADYNKIEACLKSPDSKWKNKPVTNFREWINPLKNLVTLDTSTLIQQLRYESEKVLNISLENDNLSIEEKEKMENLLPKYTSEEWIKYGRWCPIKDLSRR